MNNAASQFRDRLVFGLALTLLAACGGASKSGRGSDLEGLRAAADSRPQDAVLQQQLAAAELLASGGDAQNAGEAIALARKHSPHDPALALLAALEAELHGSPPRSLELYLEALSLAGRSDHPARAAIAEVVAASLAEAPDSVPAFRARVRSVLDAEADNPRIGMQARHHIQMLRTSLAMQAGEVETARSLSDAAGCVRQWRIAGPFGPRELLGFDRSHAAQPGSPLEDAYDLGPGRGTRSTRPTETIECGVHLGGGPVSQGGTTYAQAHVERHEDGEVWIRLESPNPVELFVDGLSVARHDRRTRPLARAVWFSIPLAAGRHELTLKVASRHPNPVFSLALLEPDAVDENTWQPSVRTFHANDPRGAFERYLALALTMTRGDVVSARTLLDEMATHGELAPALLVHRAALSLVDPLAPGDVRHDQARQWLSRALEIDPDLWYAAVQLARLDATTGRDFEAIEALRQASARWPEVIAARLTLVDLLERREWFAEAQQLVEQAAADFPGVCGVVQAALRLADAQGKIPLAHELAQKSVQCDARSGAWFTALRQQRRWNDAWDELQRLTRLEPDVESFGGLLARVDLARKRGDDDALEAALDTLRVRFPRAQSPVLDQADRWWAEGAQPRALQTLDQAVEAEPSAMAELRRVRRSLWREHEKHEPPHDALTPHRMDGLAAVRAFEQAERHYDGPQVLVLDYMLVRVFEDGSSLQLIHNIFKLQSQEAIERQGEFELPDGGELLTLRTIKQDGEVLEPDTIHGKDSISLPMLKPGDYVEAEYVVHHDAPAGFPGGYLGDRFYFESFETPFDLSHLKIIAPASLPLTLDPRGQVPPMQTQVQDGLRTIEWRVEESRPLVAEPGSVPAREYLASINVGVHAHWAAFVDGLVDLLADRDVVDPEVVKLVDQILAEVPEDDVRGRAEQLYAWVLRNIESTDDGFGQAATMLKARVGNRARVLRYLLDLAGIESQLGLARSAAGDATKSKLADADTYGHLLVRARVDRDWMWLSTVDRWAPFGYIPALLRDQQALLLVPSAEETALRTLRVRGDASHFDRHEVEWKVNLRADGSARVDARETLYGAHANAWREQLEQIPMAALDRRFEAEYLSQLLPGALLASLTISHPQDADQPLVLEYSFDVRSLGRKAGGYWAVGGLFPTQVSPSYARASTRTQTQLVAPPLDMDIVIRLSAGQGLKLPVPPDGATLRAPGGARYAWRSERVQDELVIHRTLKLPLSRISPEDYARFARTCREIDRLEARELKFRITDK